MNTFWLKAAGIAIAVVVVILVVNALWVSEPEPAPKSFYEVVEEDKERFLSKPKPPDATEQERPTPDPEAGNETMTEEQTIPAQQPRQKPEAVTLYFSELSEFDKIEAERLLNVAVPGRSIGRLPTTGFRLMVDSCRQMIRRWPDSWYAYKAKLMLADMPERFRPRYKITREELDLSRFAEPREGTKPLTIR
jgi:hypothetical protein